MTKLSKISQESPHNLQQCYQVKFILDPDDNFDIKIEWADDVDNETVSTKLSNIIGAVTSGLVITEILQVLKDATTTLSDNGKEIMVKTTQKLLKFYDQVDRGTFIEQDVSKPLVSPTKVFRTENTSNEIN